MSRATYALHVALIRAAKAAVAAWERWLEDARPREAPLAPVDKAR